MLSLDKYKIILDSPSVRPALGFDQAATALKEIIEGSRPQFAVGIFGTWGSGKTTLMNAIERKLDPTKTIAVSFSAWRYEREPHLIVPLLDTVREALMNWARDNEPFKAQALKTASTVGKALAAVLAGLSFEIGVPNAAKMSFKANEALAQAEKFDDQDKDATTSRSFYHATFKALHNTFTKFVGPATGRRIVVFVDDLDRCLPQGALEVLETMKLFFDLEGFVFVVGLDQAVVERSIDIKYRTETRPGDVGEKAAYEIRGADYIKKIFQLPYAVAPVAVSQLDEFLDAVYSESDLHPDQDQELRTVVAPHLHYLVTESGVNPREIKRYLNAYTLVRKIKPHLDRNVILALQTVAFRRDWEIARRALLSYRGVFTDAAKRQIEGADSAIVDLDPTLTIPESFITYVTPGSPGAQLLSAHNLDEYIYTGEATTSTRGSEFIDCIRDVASLTTSLRQLEKQESDVSAYNGYKAMASAAMSRAKSVTQGRLERTLRAWTEHLDSESPHPAALDSRISKGWFAAEEGFRRKFLNQLMELYLAGSQTASSGS
jgi:KAP family P-loop domain